MEIAFYVYVLKTLSGRVFYVGKGSNNRMMHHRHVLSHPETKYYRKMVYVRMREILGNEDFTEEKVFTTMDEREALLHEMKLINDYGFANLVNTQSHAFTGRKLKPEVGRLIASKLRGRKMPPEVAAKISASNRGKKCPGVSAKTWKTRRSNGNDKLTPEQREKIKQARLGTHLTEATKEKLRLAFTGRKVSEATQAKRLESFRNSEKRTGNQRCSVSSLSKLTLRGRTTTNLKNFSAGDRTAHHAITL
jgi:hypothetical protein